MIHMSQILKVDEQDSHIYVVYLSHTEGYKETVIDVFEDEMSKKEYPCWPLTLSLEPCGGKITIDSKQGFPREDVLCPCGNQNHWLIKYGIVEG